MDPERSGDWVVQVMEACTRVREVEGMYFDEIHARRVQRELGDARFPRAFPAWDPASDRLSFYSHVWHSEGIYASRRYPPIRTVLEGAAHAVARHPALAPILDADGPDGELRVRILNHDTRTSCLGLVAGVMSRAEQVGTDGFRIAARELGSLLDASLDEGTRSPKQ